MQCIMEWKRERRILLQVTSADLRVGLTLSSGCAPSFALVVSARGVVFAFNKMEKE